MIESQVVKGWMEKGRTQGRAEGRAEGEADATRANLRKLLQSRSPEPLHQNLVDKLAAADLDTLRRWFELGLNVASVDQFRSQINGA